MIEFLLKLLGAKIENAAHIASAGLHFRNGGMIGWVLLLALVFGALTWWTYSRGSSRDFSPTRKRVLIGLRAALFVLILLALLRPIVAFAIEGKIRRLLVVLIDTSGSMNIQDPRVNDADIKRAAIGRGLLSASKGLTQPLDKNRAAELKQIPRIELLKSVVQNDELKLFQKLRHACDVQVFSFGQSIGELGEAAVVPSAAPEAKQTRPKETESQESWVKNIMAKSPTTALGDALREVITRKRGQPLAGIFVATDGANNAGAPPLAAANLAAQEGVPLYLYGVGITSPRDIIVSNLFAPDVAFAKDELAVTVRVRGQGLRGETAKVSLKLGEEIVASQDVAFAGDEEQIVPLRFTPERAGEFELQAAIPPRADETIKDNNSVSQRLRVLDSKIKVLYVEQTPRWEFKHMMPVLQRDRRIEAKFVLMEGDRGLAQAEGSPYLAGFPSKKDELFKFDLVILGDVSAKNFTPEQIELIAEFVSKFGGACAFIAGKSFNPLSYRNSVLEKMLPVELMPPETPSSASDQPLTLELTPLGRTSQMLALAPKADENSAIWKKFPPVYWVNKVARAKPAAQVFVVDADPQKATRFGKMPVIAQQQYGLGQVLYVGTDNLWRWRKNTGDPFYEQLWGQLTQRMALTHLLGGSKRTQLTSDKQRYSTGERVSVYARIYSESYEPVREPSVRGSYIVRKSGEAPLGAQDVLLRAVPDQPGMYRGDFIAIAPGTYGFSVSSDPKTVLEFTATEAKFELGETAMNESLLKEMARVSGGTFFREEDLHKLPSLIATRTQAGIRSEVDAEIWSAPFYFLLIVGVVTAEWILRKRWHLK